MMMIINCNKYLFNTKLIRLSEVFTIIFSLIIINALLINIPTTSADILSQNENLDNFTVETTAEIFPGHSEMILSHLPRVGDVINATFVVTSTTPHSAFPFFPSFHVRDGLEFVNIPDDFELTYRESERNWLGYYPGEYTLKGPWTSIEPNTTKSFTVQVRATSEGLNVVRAVVVDESAGIDFVIGPTETLFRLDYYDKYPDEKPVKHEIQLPQTYEEQLAIEEKYDMSFGTTIRTNITQTELVSLLQENEYSDSVIQNVITNINTNSTVLDSRMIVYGQLTMDNTNLSPDTSSVINIHGANVCLREYDNILGVHNVIFCGHTSNAGLFIFLAVPTTPTSNDNSLDLSVQFKSNSRESIVQDANANVYQISGVRHDNVSTAVLDLSFHIPANPTAMHSIPARAFLIIDAIADAHEFIADEFGISVPKETVYWQHDEGTDVFNSNGPGAFHISRGNTAGIYLNGYDNATNINNPLDHSLSRFVIIHEWGHHHMFETFGSDYPNGLCDPNDLDQDGATNDHSIMTPSTVDCAWREGWADILPSLVDSSLNSAVYPWTTHSVFDFENAELRVGTNRIITFPTVNNSLPAGELSEGRVASAIWDIFDSNVANPADFRNSVLLDDRSEGIDEIATIMNNTPPTFEEFYLNWTGTHSSLPIDNIMELHNMSFVLPPPPQLPLNTTTIIGATPSPSTESVLISGQTSAPFNSPTNNVNSIVVSVPSLVNDAILHFNSDTDFSMLSFDTLAATSYFTPLQSGQTTAITFPADVNISNVRIDVNSDSFGIVRLGYTTLAPEIITFTVQRTAIDKLVLVLSESIRNLSLDTENFNLNTGIVTGVETFEFPSKLVRLTISGIPNPVILPRVTFIATLGNLNSQDGGELEDGQSATATARDSDRDGLFDYADSCPREPETFNGYQDTDGCPDELIIQNRRPNADSGIYIVTVTEGDRVPLDGSASTDPDGDSLNYMWSQTDSTGITIPITNHNRIRASFVAPDVATVTDFEFVLLVTEQREDPLSDTDSLTVRVNPIIEGRNFERFISSPLESDYASFGRVMDTHDTDITIGMRNGFHFTNAFFDAVFTSDMQPEFTQTANTNILAVHDTFFSISQDNTMLFVNSNNDLLGALENILEIDYNPETNTGSDADNSIILSMRNDSSAVSQSNDLPDFAITASSVSSKYLFVLDNQNGLGYVVAADTGITLAQFNYGLSFLIDGNDGSLIRDIHPASYGGRYGMQVAMFDEDSFAVSDVQQDVPVLNAGTIFVYDNVTSGPQLSSASYDIVSPEANTFDRWGTKLTPVGTNNIAASGTSMNNIHVLTKQGTPIISYPNPDGGNYAANALDSLGDLLIVARSSGNVYLYNTTTTSSTVPVGIIPKTATAIATNEQMGWILIGNTDKLYLYDVKNYTSPLLSITDDSISSNLSLSFAKNKILVGLKSNSPGGISYAGSIYIYSPITGRQLEVIDFNQRGANFGTQIGYLDGINKIVVASDSWSGDGHSGIGRLFVYENLNNAPLAVPQVDLQEATAGQTVTLDATNSMDIDGDLLTSYTWTQTDTSGFLIPLSNVASPSFVLPADIPVDTVLSFSLTVHDGIVTSQPASISVTVSNVPQSIPDAPTALVATAISTSEILLEWVGPANMDAADIVGYSIERESPVGGGFAILVPNTSNATSTSFVDDQLASSTQYNYRVSTINTAGTSNPSNPSSATTLVANIPPIANDDTYSVLEDATMTLTVLDNDSDPDGVIPSTAADSQGIVTATTTGGFHDAMGTYIAYYTQPSQIPPVSFDDTSANNATKTSSENTISKEKLEQIKADFNQERSEYQRLKDDFKEQEQLFEKLQLQYLAQQEKFEQSKVHRDQKIITDQEFEMIQKDYTDFANSLDMQKEQLQGITAQFKEQKALLKVSKDIKEFFAGNSDGVDPRIKAMIQGSQGVTSQQENTKIPVFVQLDANYTGTVHDILHPLTHDDTIITRLQNTISATLTESQLDNLVQSDKVQSVSLPELPELYDISSITSQGITTSHADRLHSQGINGTSVTIAVIDDSFVLGSLDSVSYSALFDSSGLCGGSISCGKIYENSHGTATAGIIQDMAPGSELELYAIANSIDFVNAINHIIQRGQADVISISLGFPAAGGDGTTGHFRDGTSIVAKAVNDARNAGILVITAAGNDAARHWSGNYTPSSTVSPESLELSESYQSVLEFDGTADGLLKACLPVHHAGWSILSWNQWDTTTQDYDMFLYDGTMDDLYAYSAHSQSENVASPLEILRSTAKSNACIVVASINSTQNHYLHINTVGGAVNSPVSNSSISTPADAAGSVTAGAVNYATGNLESFSSVGPTDDGRAKPEICGYDGVSSIQDRFSPFYGTSAAAPHIAGTISLLLQLAPDATSENILATLYSGAQGLDDGCGAGIMSLLSASQNVTSTNQTRTPTPVSPDESNPELEHTPLAESSVTISAVTQPENGSVTITNNSLSVLYTPNPNYNGQDMFSYVITDDAGDTDTATVSISVTPVNDAPVITPITDRAINVDAELSFTVTAVDPDDDILSYSLSEEPFGATINNTTNMFNWTPLGFQVGDHTFDVVASDGTASDSQEVTITVNGTVPIISSVHMLIANMTHPDARLGDNAGWTVKIISDENQNIFYLVAGVYRDLYYSDILSSHLGLSEDATTSLPNNENYDSNLQLVMTSTNNDYPTSVAIHDTHSNKTLLETRNIILFEDPDFVTYGNDTNKPTIHVDNTTQTITLSNMQTNQMIATASWNHTSSLDATRDSSVLSDNSNDQYVLFVNNSTNTSYLFDVTTKHLLLHHISNAGGVFVFDSTGNPIHVINNPQPTHNSWFGTAIESIGDKVLISSTGNIVDGYRKAGAVHIFNIDDWSYHATLPNPEPQSYESFGTSIAVLNDDMVAIGVPGDNSGDNPYTGYPKIGAVHTFNASNQQHILKIPNPTINPGRSASFGISVIPLSDNTIAVGEIGFIHIIDYTTGNLVRTMSNSLPNERNNLGTKLLNIDKSDASIIITYTDNKFMAFNGTTGDLLYHTNMQYASDISLLSANIFAVGHLVSYVDNMSSVGHVSLYDGITGNLLHTIDHPHPRENDYFGRSIDIVNDLILIGVLESDQGRSYPLFPGTAYVFEVRSIADNDSDGIQNELDTQPDVVSTEFSDVIINGTTTAGTIQSHGNQTIIISDAPNPDGVLIAAGNGKRSNPGIIHVCDDSATLSLDANESVMVTCESVIISAITGMPNVTFVPDGEIDNDNSTTYTATIPKDNSITFDPIYASFETLESNTDTIIVTTLGDYGQSQDLLISPNATLKLPVANNHSYDVQEDTRVDVALVATPGNGYSTSANTMSFHILTNPANGTISEITTLNATASTLSYTPDANYFGEDSFTFYSRDGTYNSIIGTISINLTPVNDALIITPIINHTIEPHINLSFTVTATDDDDTDILTFSLSSNDTAATSGATINPTTGTFSWIPSQTGVFAFDVMITDNETPPETNTVSFIVFVRENIPPVITVPPPKTFEATAVFTPINESQLGQATAVDILDPNPTITNDSPESFPIGNTTITWTAQDAAGNTSSDTQIITIQDTIPPVITLIGDSRVTIESDSVYIDEGVIAIDNIDGNITSNIITINPINTNITGTYTVTYNATDSSDNTSITVTRIVTVENPSSSLPDRSYSQKIYASDGGDWDHFGYSVDISNDVIVIGSPLTHNDGLHKGSAYIFELNSTGTWIETAKLSEQDGAELNQFGTAVSVGGDTVAVISNYRIPDPDDPTDYNGHTSGAVSIFEQNSTGAWINTQKILLNNTGRYHPGSISVHQDTMVVGTQDSTRYGKYMGITDVFEKNSNGTWIRTAQLKPDDIRPYAALGYSVDTDGNRIITSALGARAAYIFERNSIGAWTNSSTKIVQDASTGYARFGYSVSISGDIVVVGADDETINGVRGAGSAYVFEKDSSGWPKTAKLIYEPITRHYSFGSSVSVDDDTMIIGGYGDSTWHQFSGSAHVYEKNNTGWTKVAKIIPERPMTSIFNLGSPVTLYGDTLVAGVRGDTVDGDSRPGSAYIYSGNWSTFERSSDASSLSDSTLYSTPTLLDIPDRYFTLHLDGVSFDPYSDMDIYVRNNNMTSTYSIIDVQTIHDDTNTPKSVVHLVTDDIVYEYPDELTVVILDSNGEPTSYTVPPTYDRYE